MEKDRGITITNVDDKEQCNIDRVSNWFYCEIESNPAQETCKEQCNYCKKEWDKMNED